MGDTTLLSAFHVEPDNKIDHNSRPERPDVW